MPLFHVTGEVPVMLNSFVTGRCMVMMPKWDAGEALRLIEKEKITYFVGVPTMSLELMTHPDRHKYDLSSLTDIAAGGAPRPVSHVERLRQEFPLAKPALGYGLTETNAVGCHNFWANYAAKPGSTGRAHKPYVELAILGERRKTSRRRAKPAKSRIRTAANIKSYWQAPEATAALFTPDGYVRTGDVGYLDEDGYLFIVDRKKDIIIRGGENISAAEVEAACYACPAVAEASVFGAPDERLGEVPVAVIHANAALTAERAAGIPRSEDRQVQSAGALHLFRRTAAAPGHWQDRPARAESAVRQLKVDRRTLLIGGGAGVGLIVAFVAYGRAISAAALSCSAESRRSATIIKIARDGRITVAVPQVETGQGIWTALPQIVADELGAAWETVAVEPAPLTGAYANPLAKEEGWPKGARMTAGATSVRAFEQPLREAAAVGAQYADRCGRRPLEREPERMRDRRRIRHQRRADLDLRRARRGSRGPESAAAAGAAPDRQGPADRRTDAAARRSRQDRWQHPLRRGRAASGNVVRLGADCAARRAAHRLCARGNRASAGRPACHRARRLDRRGGRQLVGRRACAESKRPSFSGTRAPADLRPLFDDALANGNAHEWFSRGDYDATVRGSRPLAATYYVAPSLHLGLEPSTATARLSGLTLEVWAPTQAPGFAHACSRRRALPDACRRTRRSRA